MEKTCSKCKISKSTKEFHQHKHSKDKLKNACKSCRNLEKKIYRAKNIDKINEYNKQYELINKEKRDIYKKSYMKTYRQKNKSKLSEQSNLYAKNRQSIDIQYKLNLNLRKRLGAAIRNNQKVGSAVRDLGCSVPELKIYLESLFQPGMTWENWGLGKNKWHIDHIKPLASFDLTKRDQFLEACHYSNLQPLWSYDNLKKGKSLI